MRTFADFGQIDATAIIAAVHVDQVDKPRPCEHAEGQQQNCSDDK